MLAYRHLFHAGNFADVFKHALLTRLLILLARKDKPFCYLDTHAGVGLYDLLHPWARKLAEYEDGIARLWKLGDIPELLLPYVEAVRAENPNRSLRFYPGSPRIARRFLRPGDRMVLSELNKDDCAALAGLFEGDRPVVVQHIDGYQALKAFLPPKERRGLVFVDSSFDRSGEFARLTEALVSAHRRFATGVYALWYPLIEPAAMHGFERAILASGIRKVLQLELAVLPEGWTMSLRGCGLLVVNPPFGFEAEARPLLNWLGPVLFEMGESSAGAPLGGGVRIRWLVPE
ncbi:MAG TPA: 23S rRNA (adenine(2030)-N(6))-methyltransferase RlmJ [Burkholderiales bacterium]|nr:23S rRNA (adenine(2030)-N(6))-methyltransferase RlmJ [Burkholderiales bacterium]